MQSVTRELEFVARKRYTGEAQPVGSEFSVDTIGAVRRFHSTFPQYRPTPLVPLPGLAAELGVAGVWVKDESKRFDLNSFKVLGGSYAVARYLGDVLGIPPGELSFARLNEPEARQRLGTIDFVTATDGNHGRSVAWSARELGHRAVVFMPKGTVAARIANIQKEGAEVHVTDGNYDETIRTARAYMQQHGGVIVQDTAWEGYRDIPLWIMQGYAVVAHEAVEQAAAAGVDFPSHAFLQAGVGSFAAGAAGLLASYYGTRRPRISVIEPTEAACYYASVDAGDGEPHDIGGEMPSIMAGLACGEPNRLAWPILRDHADLYFRVADSLAACGMRTLAEPRGDDPAIVAGESAAVAAGLALTVIHDPACAAAAGALGMDRESHLLIFSTEGDTDPEHYRRVIAERLYPTAWEASRA
ncbi:MAG: diaminopropionate ammonia-lyase [Spirochaetaceae bacterium]|nr:MAG: diaminopropionate ammonia-lyase [Spirochaetaceae bacterium]